MNGRPDDAAPQMNYEHVSESGQRGGHRVARDIQSDVDPGAPSRPISAPRASSGLRTSVPEPPLTDDGTGAQDGSPGTGAQGREPGDGSPGREPPGTGVEWGSSVRAAAVPRVRR